MKRKHDFKDATSPVAKIRRSARLVSKSPGVSEPGQTESGLETKHDSIATSPESESTFVNTRPQPGNCLFDAPLEIMFPEWGVSDADINVEVAEHLQ